MNNENEIERMASIIIKHPLESHASAVELQEKGIGDKEQAVKEFAEKLKDMAHSLAYISGYIEIDFNRRIDDLITELYGDDKNEN